MGYLASMRMIWVAWVVGLTMVGCGLDSNSGPGRDAAPPLDGSAPGDQPCVDNGDCVLMPISCCGACGAATRGDAIAVNVDNVTAQRNLACQGDMGCPACAGENQPDLAATCENRQCRLVDLVERTEITGCTQDFECMLRKPGCCACSEALNTFAIRVDAEPLYQALVCAPDEGCPECEPNFPSNMIATCTAGTCTASVLLR